MAHVDLYLSGERDYSKITGPTGPLVYPAGHVYIHNILHYLTDSGNSVASAQANIRRPLHARLHSIFVLRLFNDCWSVVFVQAAILALQTGVDGTGILLYSLSLSVKMSALLYLPGLLVVLFKRHGMIGTARYMAKWTVNWRFLDEEVFLSPSWAMSLLLGHVTLLTAFGLCRWCKSDGGTLAVIRRGFLHPFQSPALSSVSPDYIATVLMTSNLIGILFARSLHYQFYSWYCQQLPFLCRRTKYPLALQLLILAGIEYAWNVFPSTTLSSGILLAVHVLLLLGIWLGFPEGMTVVS
ncbi:mannosyltransferase [Pisolithus marmoratus]|nr:mannosyltransferase [Pisolithus marmoratus]